MECKKLTVRVCRTEDLPALRRICEETASIPVATEKQRQYLHLVYCDIYVLTQTEHCFVAVDETDTPLGYLLCAPDTAAFLRCYRKDYLPQIDLLGPSFALQGRFAQTIHAFFAHSFSAHLHIDLCEKARHSGTGTALMHALKAHLATIGIHTLFLSCASNNQTALAFYERNGFVCKAALPGLKILVCHF